jgi:hypothetical protein
MKVIDRIIILLVLECGFFLPKATPQSYHAINGSPYAGVAGIYVNPASSVNSVYKWNVNILSLQAEASNTSFLVNKMSLTKYDSSSFNLTNGYRPRYFHANTDISLLNVSYKPDNKNAFSFGIRGRMFAHIKQAPYYYNDTITTVSGFLSTNTGTQYLNAYAVSSGWLEFNFNYARTLVQTKYSRLTGGITVAYMKGLSGVYSHVDHLTYNEDVASNAFELASGRFSTEVSSNYDSLSNNKSAASNVHYFLGHTKSSVNFNIGFEYLFKNNYDGQDINEENYDWKIGVSIMDIGKNRYTPSANAFIASDPNTGADVSNLKSQIDNVKDLSDLKTLTKDYFLSVDSIKSIFKIANPTRMVINVDRNFGNHFYVNGELNINFYSTSPLNGLHTREINLVTVTPRWEKRNLGFYMPIQYNSQGQLWMGGAVKLGPLLFGVHSLDFTRWFKTRTQDFNGGFYLMLNIHPFKQKEFDGIDCPVF